MRKAIGGYFGLELPEPRSEYHRDALRVQSGRAALQAALRSLEVRRLWIPWFICHAVVEAAAAAATEVRRYTLDALDAVPDFQPDFGEAVLVVDYFGLCGHSTTAFARRVPSGCAIVDATQAFYTKPGQREVPTFYSPRKFFGVPDGGYLLPNPALPLALVPDSGSSPRMAHLFRRLTGDVQGGYADFQEAEASLNEPGIRGMSALTLDLLRRIDYETAAQRRRDNFAFLHARFGQRNALAGFADRTGDAVPFCYPLLLDRPIDGIRGQLRAEDIFVPHYWPELVRELPDEANMERGWVTNLLALPCDQRYTPEDLERLADALDLALLDRRTRTA